MGIKIEDLAKVLEILKLIKAILEAIKEMFPDDKETQARARACATGLIMDILA